MDCAKLKNNLIGWILLCLCCNSTWSRNASPGRTPPGAVVDLCDRGESAMDRAWVTIETKSKVADDVKMELHGQIAACYKCKLVHVVDIPADRNCTVQLPTMFTNTLEVRINTDQQRNKVIWRSEVKLTEHSEYRLQIFENSSFKGNYYTNFYTENEGMDVNLPIYVAMSVFVVCSVIWVVLRKCGILTAERYKKIKAMVLSSETLVQAGLLQDLGSTEGEGPQPAATATSEAESKKPRLRSLDAFRGLCLCVMIFVNYGGGGYWFFDHSYWNGLTVADLVFPWFTWIIGTSIALALRNQVQKGVRKAAMTQKVLVRTAILFGLGMALESSDGSVSVSMSHLRIPGVLQRLAVSYATVALIQIHFAEDYVTNPHRNKSISPVRDVLPYWMEWIFMLVLVSVHLLLTFLIQVPGCPVGYVGPGGLSENGDHHNCTGGAASYIDRWLFGEQHIYQTPTCQEVYKTTVPHDPEGLLGTLTSIFMCFLGLQAGKILLLYDDWVQRTIRWTTWATLLGLFAGCLCRFSQNEGWIPVNKNLWSLTFILSLSSMAFLLFTACYLFIDVFNLWTGAPFVYPGMNSILVYVCHIVFNHYFPVSWSVAKQHASLLPLHLWGVTFWTGVAALLYYKKIFLAI